eukprot:gene40070-49550_t
MQLLRQSENPEYKYSLAFLGFEGGNPAQAEIELTYNWGVESYEMGTAYGHIALGVPDAYAACEKIRASGGNVTREAGPVKGGTTVIAFVTDPDGYKIELIQRAEAQVDVGVVDAGVVRSQFCVAGQRGAGQRGRLQLQVQRGAPVGRQPAAAAEVGVNAAGCVRTECGRVEALRAARHFQFAVLAGLARRAGQPYFASRAQDTVGSRALGGALALALGQAQALGFRFEAAARRRIGAAGH